MSQIDFYRSFYGENFIRHFRRPTDQNIPKNFRTQITVKNPEAIYFHVTRTNGQNPSYVHVHDQYNFKSIDRAYFDFDINHPEVKEIIKELQDIRYFGVENENKKQIKLKIRLNELIIGCEIAKPAIDEAKKFANIFKQSFGKIPMLLFSGCKGAHVYAFFKPTQFNNYNKAILWFAENVKKTYKFNTQDLSVNKNALSGLSRVPYSKHHYTNLTVVPFQISDDYDTIMQKTVYNQIKPFNKEDHITDFNLKLLEIDKKFLHYENIVKTGNKSEFKTNGKYGQDYKHTELRKLIKIY
jgi:hypothetical protein